jgi:hypothetical protein
MEETNARPSPAAERMLARAEVDPLLGQFGPLLAQIAREKAKVINMLAIADVFDVSQALSLFGGYRSLADTLQAIRHATGREVEVRLAADELECPNDR